ncbi:MAG: membrane protein insertion efficiency factor YidD [Burkholderiaceae bacterium]
MRLVLLSFIGLYRATIRPFLGTRCRFHPSCSEYALESIRSHGAVRGAILALRRVGRCNPWHAGGYDPVPPVCDHQRHSS